MDSKGSNEIALLAIQPKYVRSIILGEKKVEFRRQLFSRPIEYVVMYGTTPIRKVVAYFRVSYITQASPFELWEKYHEIAGIGKRAFEEYFQGAKQAIAIGIGSIKVLSEPVTLHTICDNLHPPQSFAYLSQSVLEKLRKLA